MSPADLIAAALVLVDDNRRDYAAQRIADETTCVRCGGYVALNEPDCDRCWYRAYLLGQDGDQ